MKDGIARTENYRGVTITVRCVSETIYVARNDYEEPEAVIHGFLTADEAIENEKLKLDAIVEAKK